MADALDEAELADLLAQHLYQGSYRMWCTCGEVEPLPYRYQDIPGYVPTSTTEPPMPEPLDIAALREAWRRLRKAITAAPTPEMRDAVCAFTDDLLSEVEAERDRGRALRAAVEALAEEHERTVTPAPYTSERALIERLRSLLAAHVPSPPPVGGAAGVGEVGT